MLTRHLARHMTVVTEMVLDGIPLHRVGSPDDVGGTAVWLASRVGAYLTGAVIPVSGGLATL